MLFLSTSKRNIFERTTRNRSTVTPSAEDRRQHVSDRMVDCKQMIHSPKQFNHFFLSVRCPPTSSNRYRSWSTWRNVSLIPVVLTVSRRKTSYLASNAPKIPRHAASWAYLGSGEYHRHSARSVDSWFVRHSRRNTAVTVKQKWPQFISSYDAFWTCFKQCYGCAYLGWIV